MAIEPGNLVKPPRIAPTRTAGVGGSAIYGGFLHEVEQQSRLTGSERYRTFSQILANVTIVATGVRMYLALLGKQSWKAEPPDAKTLDKLGMAGRAQEAADLAELVEDIIYDMRTPWHRVVRRAGMFAFYGFSLQEWTAKRRADGVIGFLDIEPRPQSTITQWFPDDEGNIQAVVQTSPQTAEELVLPRSKLVYMVDDSVNDSPEGFGLFRQMAEGARILQRYEQLEGWGFELDLRGMPLGRAPLAALKAAVAAGDLTEEQADAMVAELTKLLKDHVKNPNLYMLLDSAVYTSTDEAGTPSSVPLWDFTLAKGDPTGQEEAAEAIMRKTRELARLMGIEHLLLGESGAGSLAMSKDKSNNFKLLIDSALVELAETFEVDIVDVLFQLNGWDARLKPTLKTDMVQMSAVEDVTAALRDMATAGAVLVPDDPVIGEVRDLMGLSRPVDTLMAEDAVLGDGQDDSEGDGEGEEEGEGGQGGTPDAGEEPEMPEQGNDAREG